MRCCIVCHMRVKCACYEHMCQFMVYLKVVAKVVAVELVMGHGETKGAQGG
jgi:hypothetical protein